MILGDNASSRIFLWDKCNYYQKKSVSNYERVNTFKKHGVFTVMDDKQIINLFFQRDEDAINAVDQKYGSKLNALAANRRIADTSGQGRYWRDVIAFS